MMMMMMKKYIVTQRPKFNGLSTLVYICEAKSKAQAVRLSEFKKEPDYNMPLAQDFKENTRYLV